MKNQFPLLDLCEPRSCTCSMIKKGNRAIDAIYRKHLAPFNISTSQLSILFVAAKSGGITQAKMSSMLVLEKSTLNRNLSRLLLEERLEKKEKRILKITTSGKELLETIIPAWEEAKKEVAALLGEDGLNALRLLTTKLTNT